MKGRKKGVCFNQWKQRENASELDSRIKGEGRELCAVDKGKVVTVIQ